MIIGVPKEIKLQEHRIGLTPDSVKVLNGKGHKVLVETNGGLEAGFTNQDYKKSGAIIYDKAPWDILTYNSSKASLPAEEGIPISKMNGTQRNIIESLISEYINQVPEQLAERKFKELREFGLDKVYFAWAGPTKIGEEHYYRIHGGNFVVEFDLSLIHI